MSSSRQEDPAKHLAAAISRGFDSGGHARLKTFAVNPFCLIGIARRLSEAFIRLPSVDFFNPPDGVAPPEGYQKQIPIFSVSVDEELLFD
jgi:hypothetical protein